MNVTICGAGPIGLTLAAAAAASGARVSLFTNYRDRTAHTVRVLCADGVLVGRLHLVSSEPSEVLAGAEMVLLALPAPQRAAKLRFIGRYASPNAWVGSLPGGAGFEREVQLFTDCRFFGSRRTAVIALKHPTFDAEVTGVAPNLEVAGSAGLAKMLPILRRLFSIPVRRTSYLSVTLCPANVVTHTARLLSGFPDGWLRGPPSALGFYSDWDDAASELCLKLGEDAAAIARAADIYDLPTLREHYGVDQTADLTRRLRSLDSLRRLRLPTVQTAAGVRLDITHRMVTEEAFFGLPAILDEARRLDVTVPTVARATEDLQSLCRAEAPC
jgi:NAD/NADP octopine/nopaline dehydrogenase, alpha-helical domain